MASNFSFKAIGARFDSKQLLFAWYRHYKMLFFAVFLCVLGFGGWSWYYSLYQYRWTDEQKREFLDTYAKETNFKEAKFRDTVDRLKNLADKHEKAPVIGKDLFTGKSVVSGH